MSELGALGFRMVPGGDHDRILSRTFSVLEVTAQKRANRRKEVSWISCGSS
jgi:hypothetical protein